MLSDGQPVVSRTIFIGEAAKKANVTVKAIRYYERIGLIPEAGRNEGKFRIFPMETVERMEFIKRAQALGFTLEEISEFLAVYDQGECSCGQVRISVEQKLKVIDHKLKELRGLKKDLLVVHERLASQKSERTSAICPVIHESRRHLKG